MSDTYTEYLEKENHRLSSEVKIMREAFDWIERKSTDLKAIHKAREVLASDVEELNS